MKFVEISDKNFRVAIKIVRSCFKSKAYQKEVAWFYKTRMHGDWKKTAYLLHYFVVYENRKPIGITGLYQLNKGDNEFWMGFFGVIPKERKKGLGRKILEKTIYMAKKRGCKKFSMWTSGKRAPEFYINHGFKKRRPVKYAVISGEKFYKYPKNAVFYTK